MLPLNSLMVFLSVAESLSLSAAAKELSLSQPTVSFHMDSLEKHCACQLLHRTKRGISLTPYGEVLLQKAKTIKALAQGAEENLVSLRTGLAGTIAIGASTVPGEVILPLHISAFRAQYPDISFSLDIQDSSEILRRFERGHYALAVLGKAVPGLTAIPLWTDSIVLAAHPELLERYRDDLSDLAKLPLILRETSSGSHAAALAALHSKGLLEENLRIALRVSSNNALKNALLAKIGFGFISHWSIQEELQSNTLDALPVWQDAPSRAFYGLRNPAYSLPCVDRFWDYLCAHSLTKQ